MSRLVSKSGFKLTILLYYAWLYCYTALSSGWFGVFFASAMIGQSSNCGSGFTTATENRSN